MCRLGDGMITSNHKSFLGIESFKNIDDDKNINVFLLNLHCAELEDYEYILNQHIDAIKAADKVIIMNEWEAIYDFIWERIQYILIDNGIKKDNIMFVDGGSHTNGQYNHLWTPILIAMPNNFRHRHLHFHDLKDRIYHFNSLSRIPKPYRLIFTQELFRRGIDQYGLVTCGTASEGEQWLQYLESFVEPQYKGRFPAFVGNNSVSRQNFTDDMFETFGNCAIHVAVETSFENTPYSKNNQPLNEMWDRIFVTEKTILSFAMRQLPLVLSVPGTVQYVRELGYDMFDDYIDHSYDKELDPEKRIIMVADELERMCREDIRKKIYVDDRLKDNYEWVNTAFSFSWRQYVAKLNAWVYK